ncbi:MAG: Xaa-Pro peptidase family protein [Limnohabitans sp.]|nr:Xaa-Pro peptidase family protein [Limnohabitans sp.]
MTQTIGIGGSTPEIELAKIQNRTAGLVNIDIDEFQSRIQKAAKLMKEQDIQALYLHAGTSLYYFTGTKWNPSERMVGAILYQDESIDYIAPKFEEGTFHKFKIVNGHLDCWEEHESPYLLFLNQIANKGIANGNIALDESTPFFVVDQIQKANTNYTLINGLSITSGCRMQKSENEIAIIQRAKDITLEVIQAAARILRLGITEKEVVDFIHNAHTKAGAPAGSYFCIVLFGDDTQYPHGVTVPQPLQENSAVIIDTGCKINGYISDITRSFFFGTPTEEYKKIWNLEQQAQTAAFQAAQLGATCGSVDSAARKIIGDGGLSYEYELPGLPHRVGHGTGLDIHEYPYLVRGSQIILKEGMVVSNEPMLCVPGKFGIRHEDHFYMTANGPKWFTQPMHSVENPFGININLKTEVS